MAIGNLLSRLLGRDAGAEAEMFRCSACDATFKSAQRPERASCPECRSAEVSPVWSPDPQI